MAGDIPTFEFGAGASWVCISLSHLSNVIVFPYRLYGVEWFEMLTHPKFFPSDI